MNGSKVIYTGTLGELAIIPGTPYAYWTSHSLRQLFQKHPPLDRDVANKPDQPKLADVKHGLGTRDETRFIRFFWEVFPENICIDIDATLLGKDWVPYSKGGRNIYYDVVLIVKWGNNGEEIRNFPKSVIRNYKFYFRSGLAWSRIVNSEKLGMWRLPKGTVFSENGSGVFVSEEMNDAGLLGFLNSNLAYFLHLLLNPLQHTREVGEISCLPISEGLLSNISSKLASSTLEAYDLLREWTTYIEFSSIFISPSILQVWYCLQNKWIEDNAKPITRHPLSIDFRWSRWESTKHVRHWLPERAHDHPFSLRWLADICMERERMLRQRVDELQAQIDEEVYCLYEISHLDRLLIETELSQSAPDTDGLEEVESEGDRTEEKETEWEVEGLMPAEEHLRRLVHWLAHESLKVDEDGIVPARDTYLADGQLEPGLASRVKQRLADTFGPENLDTCLRELGEALGMSLENWLETEFCNYHVSLYRLRPIIWQISSRQRGTPAFSCLIYWHKLDSDTLRKIQQLYLHPLIIATQQEADRLGNQLVEQRNSGVPLKQLRELERLSRQAAERLSELKTLQERIQALLQPHTLTVTSRSEWVKEKVNETIKRGYRPERDYGVRVNIEPLKQAGILPQAADRVKG